MTFRKKSGLLPPRLQDAVDEYEAITGERVNMKQVDPDRPVVRKHYKRFLQKNFVINMGANEGERLSLRMGIKPMIREIVSKEGIGEFKSVCDAEGWKYLISPVPVRENCYNGHVGFNKTGMGDLGLDHAEQYIVYAGHDRNLLGSACELERRMISTDTQTSPWDTIKLGITLGYPKCCSEAFSKINSTRNQPYIQNSFQRTKIPNRFLNNLSLELFHYIGWTPCRYDCPESIDFAAKIDRHLNQLGHPGRVNALKYLGMPKLYIDDRRQILFHGKKLSGNAIAYTAVFSPCAFSKNNGATLFDWIFYAHLASVFASGDRVFFTDNRSVDIFSGTRKITNLELPKDALWFIFQ
ncbi:MAG: hypothetical protein MI799_13610 [Desulfobacterales bacterium]|nr:hypothetical protein [Desulfobacterales bacterium]